MIYCMAFLAVLQHDMTDQRIRPADYSSCGLSCFYLVCRFENVDISWADAKGVLGSEDSEGMHSFEDIVRAAKTVGLHPVPLRSSMRDLIDLPMPAIVHVLDPRRPDRKDHLVVLLKVEENRVVLLDPPAAAYYLPTAKFNEVWTGDVIAFAQGETEAASLMRGAKNALLGQSIVGLAVFLALVTVLMFALRTRRCRDFIRQRLRIFALTMLVLLLLGSVFVIRSFYLRSPTIDGPICILERPKQDLGILDLGPFHAQILVRNGGTKTLVISSLQFSCTCISSTFEPTSIEAGEIASIPVDVKVGNGPQNAIVIINCNDRIRPHTAQLKWHPRYKPILESSRIIDDSALIDKPYERLLKVRYVRGDPSMDAQFESFECTSPAVSIREGLRISRVIEQPNGKEEVEYGELNLRLSVASEASGGTVEGSGSVTIRQGKLFFRLPIIISIRFLPAAFVPEVSGLTFSALSKRELVGQSHAIRLATASGFGKPEIWDLPDWLSCDVVAQSSGYLLVFTVSKRPRTSVVHERVHLGAKDRQSAQMQISIHCVTAEQDPVGS